MNVDGFKIDKSDTEKLVGVKFDKKLTFDDIPLTSVKNHLEKYLLWPELHHTWELRRNAFFTSQFSCCPLVWMCRSRANCNKIKDFMKDAYE